MNRCSRELQPQCPVCHPQHPSSPPLPRPSWVVELYYTTWSEVWGLLPSPWIPWENATIFSPFLKVLLKDTQDIILYKILLARVQLYIPWSVFYFAPDFCNSLLLGIKYPNTRFYFPLSKSVFGASFSNWIYGHEGRAQRMGCILGEHGGGKVGSLRYTEY
jgi:hypothetical protein